MTELLNCVSILESYKAPEETIADCVIYSLRSDLFRVILEEDDSIEELIPETRELIQLFSNKYPAQSEKFADFQKEFEKDVEELSKPADDDSLNISIPLRRFYFDYMSDRIFAEASQDETTINKVQAKFINGYMNYISIVEKYKKDIHDESEKRMIKKYMRMLDDEVRYLCSKYPQIDELFRQIADSE